jgi:DNA-binding CsgD family transcriptional regulator
MFIMGGPAATVIDRREQFDGKQFRKEHVGGPARHLIGGLVPFLDSLVEPVVCTDHRWQIIYRNPVFSAAWTSDVATSEVKCIEEGSAVLVIRNHAGVAEELMLKTAVLPDSYGRVAAYLCRVCQDATDVLAEVRRAAALIATRIASLGNGHVAANWGLADDERIQSLSSREREVFDLILQGSRVGTVAHELFLSEHTVRNYLKRIYAKLDVHSLGELRERMGHGATRPAG